MINWKKKKDYLDLSERMKKKQAQIDSFNEPSSSEDSSGNSFGNSDSKGGFFTGFFGGNSSGSASVEQQNSNLEMNSGERRKKLAKRLMDMTSKIEEMENQIYKIGQRIEVLERKNRLNY